MSIVHPHFLALVDDHFELRISQPDEVSLRTHLARCRSCRHRYDRRLLLASLDPRAPDARQRLAVGLGLRPAARKGRSAGLLALAVAVPAMIALLCLGSPREGTFAARGGPLPSPALLSYRLDPGKSPEISPSRMRPQDELAFAYSNPSGYRRLLVFGVDEAGSVYWYYPAWTDASDNPVGIPIEKTAVRRELAEGVHHRLRGHHLRLVALFTNDKHLSVRQVEAAVSRAPRADVYPVPGVAQHDHWIEIEEKP